MNPNHIPFPTPAPVNNEIVRSITQADFDAALNADYVTPAYRHDCERIQRVAREHLGITMSLSNAERIWRAHSSMWYTNWTWVESDNEIIAAIYRFVKGRVA
jgi:MinD superfamily P-loop ATPase